MFDWLTRVEARQRAYGMHDPDCPVFRTQRSPDADSIALLTVADCTCWLSTEQN